MEAWQQWREMARESAKAAQQVEAEGCLRSSASRYYYAAYQAVTAVLLYRKLTPPDTEEAWSHAVTPQLLEEHFEPLIRSKDRRQNLAYRLSELYKLRILADYRGSKRIDEKQMNAARRDAGYIVKVAERILPEG
ncbi:MAG TPA: HEPN domain-containing protein [Chthonomonadaceae bacterium]|nr:HEPN domain-containing protein [Chthonomonadaceae bacterium]